MKIIKTVLAFALLLASLSGFSQESTNQFSVEIDPITFGFKGYGVHLRFKPKSTDHLLLGVGTYAMDFPSALVDLNKENKDKSWQIRINHGYGLFGEYHFSEVNQKWFIGTQIALQEFKIKNDEFTGHQLFSNGLLLAYAGYSWKPFGNHFYIKPWAGIGYTSKLSGSNQLETLVYHIDPIMMFATVHLGYTF